MKPASFNPWVFRAALATAAITWLLTIAMGAQVTTRGAGMAFPDWPSSDGQNMFLYPWLQSTGDKFLEHGHRLAGSLIGLMSIALVAIVWGLEKRRWVCWMATAVLLGVIVQGILGGQRVLVDSLGLACLHGIFGSWVFALMCSLALVTSRNWFNAVEDRQSHVCRRTWTAAWTLVVTVALQYVLGALLRHQGKVLYEHMGFAAAVVFASLWNLYAAYYSKSPWLMRSAMFIVGMVMLQGIVGFAAYGARFGFGGDHVVQAGSLIQTVIRTSHVLVGMLVWMAAVTHVLRVARLASVRRVSGRVTDIVLTGPVSISGGVG
ncbi:MAG TPA: COX15/CtaA family protein [Planctomycetaceae bacterium]|nr:COX15/CtaA family protein [Planctomycetaceae bacterium]